MSDIIAAIILGIVEGVTEFLPVSSTGHLILASALLELRSGLLGVVQHRHPARARSWRSWCCIGGRSGRWAWGCCKLRSDRRSASSATCWSRSFRRAVLGVLIHKQIEAMLGSPITVAVALIVGGVAILGIERFVKEGNVKGVADIPLPKVIGIGLIQCLAMVPGVSRSGATILGALSLGVERRTAAEFSFFLAIILPCSARPCSSSSSKRHETTTGNTVGFGLIGIGFVVAFVVALLVVPLVRRLGRTRRGSARSAGIELPWGRSP